MRECPLPTKLAVVAYARDSGGDRQETSVDQQIDEYRRYCEAYELQLVRIFADRAVTGKTTVGRDEFNAMIAHLEQEPRPADAVLFWDSSRSWRSVQDGQYYRGLLARMGYEVVYVADYIPPGRYGPVIATIKDVANEDYLAQISENVKRAHRFLARQGISPGGYPPVGYRVEQVPLGLYRDGKVHYGRRWVPHPEKFPMAKKAWTMRASGKYTLKEINEATGLYKDYTSLVNFFDNETYLGTLKCGELRVPNAWEPACTPEQWEVVQAQKREYREGGAYPRRVRSPYLLSGLARCAYCGYAVCGTSGGGGYRYYSCSDRKKNGKDAQCFERSKPLRADMVDRAVLRVVLDDILMEENVLRWIAMVNERLNADWNDIDLRLSSKQAELEELEQEIDNVVQLVRAVGFSETAANTLRGLEEEKARLESELERLSSERINQRIEIDENAVRFALNDMCEELSSEDTRAAQQILRSFVDHISLTRGSGELYYRLPLFSNQT